MTDARPDEQRRWALAEHLLTEHAGDPVGLVYHVGLQLTDAIRAGDEAKAEDWRMMIGVIEDMERRSQ